MATLNGLPIFKMALPESEDEGVEFISIVDEPAIESNFVKFSETIRLAKDNTLFNLTGAFLIPNFPIYRFDKNRGEYYVVFDEEEIKKIATRFLKQGKTINFNYMHEDGSSVDATLIESWFVANTDKSKELGLDLPVGSWVGTVHINDIKFWNNEIESGKMKGFSIEGFLDLKLKNNNKMAQIKLEAQAKTKDGVVLFTQTEFAVDAEVFIVDDNGNQSPAADGEYVMEDGSTIVVVESKVKEIKPAETASAETEMSEEVKQVLTDEDMAAIAEMVNKINIELIDRIAALEAKVAEIEKGQMDEESVGNIVEQKMSKVAGSESITKVTDETKPSKKSLEDKVIALQAIKKYIIK